MKKATKLLSISFFKYKSARACYVSPCSLCWESIHRSPSARLIEAPTGLHRRPCNRPCGGQREGYREGEGRWSRRLREEDDQHKQAFRDSWDRSQPTQRQHQTGPKIQCSGGRPSLASQ